MPNVNLTQEDIQEFSSFASQQALAGLVAKFNELQGQKEMLTRKLAQIENEQLIIISQFKQKKTSLLSLPTTIRELDEAGEADIDID